MVIVYAIHGAINIIIYITLEGAHAHWPDIGWSYI